MVPFAPVFFTALNVFDAELNHRRWPSADDRDGVDFQRYLGQFQQASCQGAFRGVSEFDAETCEGDVPNYPFEWRCGRQQLAGDLHGNPNRLSPIPYERSPRSSERQTDRSKAAHATGLEQVSFFPRDAVAEDFLDEFSPGGVIQIGN